MVARRQQLVARETLAVWTLFLFVAVEVFSTYSRLPLRELYHVSGTGPTAGLGRALVIVNFPTALVALPILPLVAGRLWPGALLSAALCCAIFWPGVVDQADLDAKWTNAVPAAGVALALGLTIWRAREGLAPPMRMRGDRWRFAIGALLVVLSLPWLAADVGVSFWDMDAWWSPLGQARLHHAVHHGHHHGIDGTLLVLAALLLSRTLAVVPRRLRAAVALYLGILVTYGIGNFLNDAWYEQLVKRGRSSFSMPSVLLPAANLPWAVIGLVGVLVGLVFLRIGDEGRPAADGVRWPAAIVPAAGAVALAVVGVAHGRETTAHTPLAGSGTGTIVFPMSTEGPFHLYEIGADGRGLRQLTDEDASDLAPDSSRNRLLAFQSNREDDGDVFIADPAFTAVERITGAGREGEPAWSPDAKRLALIRDGDLYVVHAHGGGDRRVAEDAHWPTWAPGGSLVAYESDRGGRGRIVVVTPDGESRVALVVRGDNRFPTWSPHGERIAFECRDGDHWHICILEPAGGGRRVLTPGGADEFAPAWSPDGRRIAFIGDRDGNDQLYVMRADGSRITRLTAGQADKDAPVWRRGR
jgi:Tol biopolymer transport system component